MITRILTAAILIAIVFAEIYLFPYPLFLLTISLVLFFSLREFSRMMSHYGALLFPPTYLLVILLPWVAGYFSSALAAYLLLSLLLIFCTSIFLTQTVQIVFPSAAGNLLALCYLGVPLAIGGLYHPLCPAPFSRAGRFEELIVVLVAIWVSDSAAYFTGRFAGRRKVTPKLSPNKTLEGYLAGLLMPPLLLPFLGPLLMTDHSTYFFVASGVVVATAGTAGDLFESILKRGAGIKDSSQLLPGHGGILDRLDSFLFAFPAYFLLTLFLDFPNL